ncbi:hypothetical protein NL676_029808 [Syzygium grande]|nr:hypothetical protein NL676_029808 [Syzygium grande]
MSHQREKERWVRGGAAEGGGDKARRKGRTVIGYWYTEGDESNKCELAVRRREGGEEGGRGVKVPADGA